ncbi:unnamed protein product [Symbiodinium pilosum]|uniref:Uncharacterized protein n=1 Tax=Symbiodinium pilosum TaxID=2952 RepID=A0A812JA85_SYMPI|nr:unnamed protein product [Symbiodinium pilosum]
MSMTMNVVEAKVMEAKVPTKNTFVHFSDASKPMGTAILTRAVSCPSIMTDFEHPQRSRGSSADQMLSFSKASFVEDDNCSAASTSGQESDDNSQGADAESTGTWSRHNSPLNLGQGVAEIPALLSQSNSPVNTGRGGAEPSSPLPEAAGMHSPTKSPQNLGSVFGVAIPIMLTPPVAPLPQTGPMHSVDSVAVQVGQTIPASMQVSQMGPMDVVAVQVGQTVPMHAADAVALQVGQTGPLSMPMPQTAPMHDVDAVTMQVGQTMPASVPMPQTTPVPVQVGQTGPSSMPMPQTAPMHAMDAVAMQVGQTIPASMCMPKATPVPVQVPASMHLQQTAPMHAMDAVAMQVGHTMPASMSMPQSAPMHAVDTLPVPLQASQTMPAVLSAGLQPIQASRPASKEPTQVVSVGQASAGTQLQMEKARTSKRQNLTMQKRINKDLVVAGRKNRFEVLKVATKNLDTMNGVNLATAFHRIAKGTTDEVEAVSGSSAFASMLVAAERYAEQELALFQIPLFAKLAKVATPRIRSCQPYEVTNLLWAFAEFYKFEQDAAAELSTELRSLLDGVADLFCGRAAGEFKVQVLTSALMSVSAIPWDQSFSQTWLFNTTFHELASRWGKAHVAVALERLRVKCNHFCETVLSSGSQKFPTVVAELEAMAAERASNQLAAGRPAQP